MFPAPFHQLIVSIAERWAPIVPSEVLLERGSMSDAWIVRYNTGIPKTRRPRGAFSLRSGINERLPELSLGRAVA